MLMWRCLGVGSLDESLNPTEPTTGVSTSGSFVVDIGYLLAMAGICRILAIHTWLSYL